jgi:predicted Zn-dependent peptidase
MQNGATQPFRRHAHSNGLRVLVAPMSHTRSVTVALFFGVGSRFEEPGEQGIAHLVEHMLFKGSRRYPSGPIISETIEGVGGILNAATDKELTVYWAKVASRHAGLALDLLADMVQQPLFDPSELAKEKKVVIDELGLAQDAPGEWVHQLLSELLWPDQPLGREIAGTPETVNAQTRESLVSYVQRGYGPANMVMMVAGDISPERVFEDSATLFDGRSTRPPRWSHAQSATGQPLVSVQQRETEQTYICLGGNGIARSDPDRYALRVANGILGDGMSSRLFVEVRERLGLAYDIHSYISAYHDAGAVVVTAGLDSEQVEAVIGAALEQVDRLRQERVPEAELQKVKEYLKGRTVLSLEDSASVAQWYATQELLTDELLTPDEVLDRIDAVTADDVQRVAQRVFVPGWLNLALIGPHADADYLRGLLRWP